MIPCLKGYSGSLTLEVTTFTGASPRLAARTLRSIGSKSFAGFAYDPSRASNSRQRDRAAISPARAPGALRAGDASAQR
jgi:hypothetical protein